MPSNIRHWGGAKSLMSRTEKISCQNSAHLMQDRIERCMNDKRNQVERALLSSIGFESDIAWPDDVIHDEILNHLLLAERSVAK